MPTYACLAVLAFTLLCRPAAATPICQYVGTSGTTAGNRTLLNPCVGYSDEIRCVVTEQGPGQARVVVVICVAAA